MNWKSCVAGAVLVAVGSFAGAAHAVTMQVNYTASGGAGTPITIGNSTSPQYSFVLGTFFNGNAQYTIQANDGAKISFPDNGVPQFKLNTVTTRVDAGNFAPGFSNVGDFQLFFDIGSVAYTGLATVTDEGRLISAISYNPVAAVPEPATWAIVLVGFGALGATMLRRRRASGTTVG